MSQRENEYSRTVSKKTDEELVEILNSHDKYIDALLQAVIWEAEKRNLQYADLQTLQKSLKPYETANEETVTPDEIISPDKVTTGPPLFSQAAILGFSLFFSPLTGGILLAINASKVKKRGVVPIILFSVLFTIIQAFTSWKLPGSIVTIILNVAGALLLSEILWNQYIGKKIQYVRRSITVPLLIMVAVLLPIVWYIYQHPEIYENLYNK